jgi:hypothetical protein
MMKWLLTIGWLPLLLCSCASMDVSLSKDKDRHQRTFAVIQHGAGEDDTIEIRRRKGNRTTMAEKALYREGNFSTSFMTGHHRNHRWMSGLLVHYSF